MATVIECVAKEKTRARPTAMNSVELMRTCSTGLGMGPQHAMRVAEQLYMQGYISYPRTETTAYSQNFDIEGTLRQIQDAKEWGKDVSGWDGGAVVLFIYLNLINCIAQVKALLNGQLVRPKGGKDVGKDNSSTSMVFS